MLEPSQIEIFEKSDTELLEIAGNPMAAVERLENLAEKIKDLKKLESEYEETKKEVERSFTLLTKLLERERKIKEAAQKEVEAVKSGFKSSIERIANATEDDTTGSDLIDLLSELEPASTEEEAQEVPTIDSVAS